MRRDVKCFKRGGTRHKMNKFGQVEPKRQLVMLKESRVKKLKWNRNWNFEFCNTRGHSKEMCDKQVKRERGNLIETCIFSAGPEQKLEIGQEVILTLDSIAANLCERTEKTFWGGKQTFRRNTGFSGSPSNSSHFWSSNFLEHSIGCQ